jgi:hypothetical protein
MRYRGITHELSNRFRLPPSHPILAKVIINPVDWFRIECLDDDNPAICILGHDAPQNGKKAVYVACASFVALDRLEEDVWC